MRFQRGMLKEEMVFCLVLCTSLDFSWHVSLCMCECMKKKSCGEDLVWKGKLESVVLSTDVLSFVHWGIHENSIHIGITHVNSGEVWIVDGRKIKKLFFLFLNHY